MKQKYSWLFMIAAGSALALQTFGVIADTQTKAGTYFGIMAPPTVSYTFNHITCRGANDGGILLSAQGVAPFYYSLDGIAFQSENSFTGLAPGTYTVRVRDKVGETRTVGPIVLTEPPVVTPTAVADHAGTVCRNGSLEISGSFLVSNDTDPENKPLMVQEITQPANGTVVENADGTFTYTAKPGFSGTDTFTYTVKKDDKTLAFSGTGHFYEFVQADKITWTDARIAAASRTYNGLRGYLVTITSKEENDFVKAKLLGQGWIGASDEEKEGVWKWVTGPEAGTHFSNQFLLPNEVCKATTAPGINGNYANWKVNEPNNCNGVEPYAHLNTDGSWNDYKVNDTNIKGYVVEYGGLETCPPVLTATTTVTVTVEPGPEFTVVPTGVTCAGGATGQIAVQVTSTEGGPFTYSLNDGPFGSEAIFDALEKGTYTVKIKGADGCESATQTVELGTRPDVTPPTITAPAPVTVSLVSGCTISGVDLGAPATADDCAVASVTNNAPATFPLGNTTVTWTVTDAAGHTATATQTVTVADQTAPVAKAKNLVLEIGVDGTVTITPADVNDGSSDNCTVAALTLDQTSFTCDQLGERTVTLTVKDNSGNESTATATVTVVDNAAPVARARNLTVYVGADGTATITAADVNDGSSDNCAFTLALDKTDFTCEQLGEHTVTLTAKDISGNESTATATVTVVDNTAPIARARNLTVQLGADGIATITAADINDGSTDNCAIADLAIDKLSFGCDQLGEQTVTLTVRDNSGNEGKATATVTVTDMVDPVARAKNIAIVLGADGTATIAAADVNDGSADNCGIATVELNKTTFTSADIGEQPVVLTVTDPYGNSATAQATVTVAAPVLTNLKSGLAGQTSFTGYPNPFQGSAHLEFTLPTDQAFTVELFDLSGRRVLALQSGKAEAGKAYKVPVEAGQLPQGIYVARLSTAERVHTLKLVLRK